MRQHELKQLVKYDPATGKIYDIKSNKIYNVDKRGRLCLENKLWSAAMLAYLYMEGTKPDNLLKSVDGNKQNIKYDNIKKATNLSERKSIELTQKVLKQLLTYDKSTGEFKWRIRVNGRFPKGSLAGSLTKKGYVAIKINGKSYLAHHLAWLYEHDYLPEQLDHKNRIRHDNKLINLRLATNVQNACNRGLATNNTTGYKGVTKVKRGKKIFYSAIVTFNKVRYNIGDFKTALEAHRAYEEKAIKLHGLFKLKSSNIEGKLPVASWDDTSFGNEKRVRIDELIKIVDYRKNTKFKTYRFVGDLQKYAQVWLPIYKDGKPVTSQATGKPINIPFFITNFDVETETFDKTKECPFVEAAEKICKYIKDDKLRKQFTPQVGHYGQAINRDLQENPDKRGKPSKTERKTGFKDSVDSDSFTPIECHNINYTIGQGLEAAKETNTHRNKETKVKEPKSIVDAKYGCDVLIKYDKDGQGQGKYKIQKGEPSPLNKEYEDEDKYLKWNIAAAIKECTLSRKDAKIEAERILKEFMKSVKGKKSDDDDSPDEDLPEDIEGDDSPVAKKSSKKKSSKKDSPDEDDSPELDSPDEEDSPADSPDEKTSKKSSKKSSKKDSPDEDDSPVLVDSPKKSSKKKSSKKDSPDEDDSPVDSPEEKKSSKKKRRNVEEDDSPVKTSKKSSKKSSKKDSPDEDEDEDEVDIDLDEEDDD